MHFKKKPKIAVAIPIGSLKKYGYQYHYRLIIRTLSKVFDKVIIASTSRETTRLNLDLKNVDFFFNRSLWFDLDSEGNEIFSIYKIYKAERYCMSKAYDLGMDFVIRMTINMYIDYENAQKMRNYCDYLLYKNIPFGFFAKAFQIGPVMTYPNTKIPGVVNLHYFKDFYFDIDVMEYKGKRYPWKGGIYRQTDFTIIDIIGVETEHDLKNKFEWYIKNYMTEWKNKDIGEFNLENEIIKLEKKLNKTTVNHKYKKSDLTLQVANLYPSNSLANKLELKFTPYLINYLKYLLKPLIFRLGIIKPDENK